MRGHRRTIKGTWLAATALLATLAPQPAVAAYEYHLTFLPPVGHGLSSQRGYLTSDWHASKLAGDGTRDRGCTPGQYGSASCSALDWGDGVSGKDPEAWILWYGKSSSADVMGALARMEQRVNGCTHVLDMHITAFDTAVNVARPTYQHVIAGQSEGWVPIFFEPRGDGFFMAYEIEEVQDASACWEGWHVHEDDDRAINPQIWQYVTSRFLGKGNTYFSNTLSSSTRTASFGQQILPPI